MECRNIFLANPARLSVHREQLVIEQTETYSIPLEDISALLIESPQVTLTARAAAALATYGVTVFLCDEKHIPCCQMLPVNQFCRQRKLLTAQCEIGKPLQKQFWQQIVIQKIRNQARCLKLAGRNGGEELRQIAGCVLSGDTDNREAVAAALYYPALFGDGFSRGTEDIRNASLNYGYAILRGGIARNLVIHGLEPCIGLHHHSELNQFNLADDLIDPFRPAVDLFVAKHAEKWGENLSTAQKAQLLNITNYMVKQVEKQYRIFSAIGRACVSLANCILGKAQRLELPELLPLEIHRYE